MIQKTTIQFLEELKKHNTKDWFDIHRKDYEMAKKNFIEFLENLLPKILAFDPELAAIKAKDCLFRINRDIRFSKNKAPYKSNFGAAISLKGRKSTYPGYYIHLEPGGTVVGGGAYMLLPDELQKVRQEIDYNSTEFLKIVNNKSFKAIYGEIKGEALVKSPKGFDPESEAASYIKHKQWYAMTKILEEEILTAAFEKKIIQAFKALHPFNLFIQKALVD